MTMHHPSVWLIVTSGFKHDLATLVTPQIARATRPTKTMILLTIIGLHEATPQMINAVVYAKLYDQTCQQSIAVCKLHTLPSIIDGEERFTIRNISFTRFVVGKLAELLKLDEAEWNFRWFIWKVAPELHDKIDGNSDDPSHFVKRLKFWVVIYQTMNDWCLKWMPGGQRPWIIIAYWPNLVEFLWLIYTCQCHRQKSKRFLSFDLIICSTALF